MWMEEFSPTNQEIVNLYIKELEKTKDPAPIPKDHPKRKIYEVAITEAKAEKSDRIKVTPMMETNSIDFEKTGWLVSHAISGPIKCDKGFKVRFDLR